VDDVLLDLCLLILGKHLNFTFSSHDVSASLKNHFRSSLHKHSNLSVITRVGDDSGHSLSLRGERNRADFFILGSGLLIAILVVSAVLEKTAFGLRASSGFFVLLLVNNNVGSRVNAAVVKERALGVFRD